MYGAALAIIQVVGYSIATQQDTWEARASLLVAFIAFATVGALVASRQPQNAIGWLFMGIAMLVALSVFGGEYANFVANEHDGWLPGGTLAAWFYVWTWFPVLGLIVLVPLLFPDGRVPGPRWRFVLWTWVGFVVLVAALWMLRPGVMNDPEEPALPVNPVGVGSLGWLYDDHDLLESVSSLVLVVFLALSVAAAVVRFRRSRGDERQQLKWMTYAVVVWIVLVPLGLFLPGDFADVAFAVTIVMLPAATAIAMFKYRLYEIDRVISRTLVYGALTVILGLAYVGLVLAGQALFSSFASAARAASSGSN